MGKTGKFKWTKLTKYPTVQYTVLLLYYTVLQCTRTVQYSLVNARYFERAGQKLRHDLECSKKNP